MNYEKYHNLLTTKRLRLLFGGYLFFLILMAVLPINKAKNTTLTDVHVISIRLDHLLHATLFIPWAFLYMVTYENLNEIFMRNMDVIKSLSSLFFYICIYNILQL